MSSKATDGDSWREEFLYGEQGEGGDGGTRLSVLESVMEDVLQDLLERVGSTGRGVLRHTSKAIRAAVDRFVASDSAILALKGRAMRLTELCRGVDLLVWSQRQGAPWEQQPWQLRVCTAAASVGCIESLQWAIGKGLPWGPITAQAAAANGQLDTLRWLTGRGCKLDAWTCSAAASGGHLEALKYARSRGCPWDQDTCRQAASGGHIELLQWCVENGCPCDESSYQCLLSAGRNPGLRIRPPGEPGSNDEQAEEEPQERRCHHFLTTPRFWIEVATWGIFVCVTVSG